MAVEEIVSGVYGIGMGYVNAFFIVGEDGLTLVDSGLAKKKDTILSAVAGAGRQPPDVGHILITHHHIDHIGSLAGNRSHSGRLIRFGMAAARYQAACGLSTTVDS